MSAVQSIATGTVPAPAASISSELTSRSRTASYLRHGLVVGIERGGLLASALAGALTFLQVEFFHPLILNCLLGAVLVGGLAAGLAALAGLAGKLAGLLLTLVGRALMSRLGPRALAPGTFVRRVRLETVGWVLAPLFLIAVDRTKIPFLSFIRLAPPAELLMPTLILAGALLGVAFTRGVHPALRWSLVSLALVINAAPAGWLLWPGYDDYLVRPDVQALAELPAFEFGNPALPGSYAIKTLTYGCGQDRRPEYGRDAALLTQTVDARAAFPGFGGINDTIFNLFWGFDFGSLPVNGRAWYPEGTGPFPIFLIVHGNHSAGDFSDPGYAYLGEHLASRGIITVSVDENFLNGFFLYDGDGKEMPVRGWLLLKHLQAWRGWNADPASPFHGKVDLDRVVVGGHSRGGEAAVHAASLNSRLAPPVTEIAEEGEFGFGIRGVVAIAAPDGQYKPYGMKRTLIDMSYLYLYGGHDQDLYWMAGLQQYQRVKFEGSSDAFKATAFIYRANHGQFNTVWGDADQGRVASLLLNRASLLSGAEQREAGKVFITAFLEATLHNRDEYRQVFQTPARARNWLPEDVYVTQYEDATFRGVNTNDRLGKLAQIEAPEGTAVAEGFVTAARVALPLRNGEKQGNNALDLAWAAGSKPVYTVKLPTGNLADWSVNREKWLAFALGTELTDATGLDVDVALVDGDGTTVVLPLWGFGTVPPAAPAYLLKSQPVSSLLNADYYAKRISPYESVLQSYRIPFAAFAQADTRFDPTQIRAIRFYFDGTRAGQVYLDEVGFEG